MNQRIRAALSRAAGLEAVPWTPKPPSAPRPERLVAMGDPQASFEKMLRVLDGHGLLGSEGLLAGEVSLLSIGDHFDYPGDRQEVGREGFQILRWLAEHPPDQVLLVAGNHDLCRVMEFAFETDERFSLARERAREILDLGLSVEADRAKVERARSDFHSDFPGIPAPELVVRDFLGFSETQRSLVQTLLLGGRFVLAQAAQLRIGGQDRRILLTHAGIAHRELSLLGLPQERDPARLARRLNSELDGAVERVRSSWEAGKAAALDLAPLHVAGTTGRQGGGLLYHRPSNPQRLAPGDGWEPEAPRRFDPRDLPRGLLQASGHSGHRSCLRELAGWVAPSAAGIERGGLRTLRTNGRSVVYEAGLVPVPEAEAGMILIDSEMHWIAAEQYPLLSVEAWLDTED